MITRPRPRRGFTLIELMIVVGIMVILATLGFMFVPNLDRNKGVPNATTQVSGWINLARQQALRDHRAHGIRLIQDANDPLRCTGLQYIEQPDPVAPRGSGVGIALYNPPAGGGARTPNTYVTLFNGGGPTPWDGVLAGDYLEVTGGPTFIAQILGIGASVPPAGGSGTTLILDRDVPEAPTTTMNPVPPQQPPLTMVTGFRVIRGPRPPVGEPMLQLHRDCYIDLTWCNPCPLLLNDPTTGLPTQSGSPPYGNLYTGFVPNAWGSSNNGNPNPTSGAVNNIDILFNSYGVGAASPTGQLILCVRHIDRPADMLLISIATRTGKITTHYVFDVQGQDPYGLTRDGKNPGL